MLGLFESLAGRSYRRSGLAGLLPALARALLDVLKQSFRSRFELSRKDGNNRPPPRVWKGKRMDSSARDLQYAWRQVTRKPGFTIIVVVTLGLAIGASTAVFSVVNGVSAQAAPL